MAPPAVLSVAALLFVSVRLSAGAALYEPAQLGFHKLAVRNVH
jgi:hypothetical protein